MNVRTRRISCKNKILHAGFFKVRWFGKIQITVPLLFRQRMFSKVQLVFSVIWIEKQSSLSRKKSNGHPCLMRRASIYKNGVIFSAVKGNTICYTFRKRYRQYDFSKLKSSDEQKIHLMSNSVQRRNRNFQKRKRFCRSTL